MKYVIYMSLLLSGCKMTSQKNNPPSNVAVAKAFIDAFYSFNRDSLQNILSAAGHSRPNMLYYQKWAECGNYKVLNRDNYFEKNDSTVIYPVTVKDDLIGALQIDFNVTDTFHIIIRNGKIYSVRNTSNDPEIYYEAYNWVKQNRSDLIEKVCEGFGKEGATPCECVRSMVKGFAEFKSERKDSIR